jgi:Glycosyltransferase family 10 (fucosyltransferase) C-term/Concanavalin A-like lectin/glucanases superfamily
MILRKRFVDRSRRRRFIVCAVLLSTVLLSVLLYVYKSSSSSRNWRQWAAARRLDYSVKSSKIGKLSSSLQNVSGAELAQADGQIGEAKVKVLLWDDVYGTPFYWGQGQRIEEPNYGGYTIAKEQCSVECEWTRDKRSVMDADVVMFDPCASGPSEWRQVVVHLPEKRVAQRWMYFTYEQPVYFPLMLEADYMNRFDDKMTYALDSLQHVSFMCPWGVGVPASGDDEAAWLRPPSAKSDGHMVAFMASNCGGGGASERTEFVGELMRHIDVHSYGRCLNNRENPEESEPGWDARGLGEMMKRKVRLIAKYRFFLAFENNYVIGDYVTEKLATALLAGTVPVYRGTATVEHWMPGDGAFIDANDFETPRALADFLLAVAADKKRFDSYFEWKRRGLRPSFRALLDNCIFNAECNLGKQVARARHLGVWSPKIDNDHRLSAIDDDGGGTLDAAPSLADDGASRAPRRQSGSRRRSRSSSSNLRRRRLQATPASGDSGALSASGQSQAIDSFALEMNRLDRKLVTQDDDYVEVAPRGSLLDLSERYTLMAWIQANRWFDGRIVDKNRAKSVDGYSLDTVAVAPGLAKLRLCAAGTCVQTATRTMHVGVWHHVAATFDEGTVRLYVNGHECDVEQPAAPPARTTDANSYPLRFGKPADGGQQWRPVHGEGIFDGTIDDIVIFGRALEQHDIWRLMFERLSGAEPDLIGYWSLNSGSGQLARDHSPNKLHGVIHGQPQWVHCIAKPLSDLSQF